MKKKLIPALLALCMAAALLTGTALAADFNDVDGHWGKDAIERWADCGVLNGKGGGKFDPNGVMTRAEFATMLVNLMGCSKSGTEVFTDLDPDAWYADAICKLAAAGVMRGDGAGKVDPMGEITREQAAVMLCRAFNIKPSGKGGMLFNDSGEVSSWAVDALTALSERGMIYGTGDNLISPKGIVNRATAAQLAGNIVAEYVTGDTVLTGPVDGAVIVTRGVKVEIRDAVVTASIVVESASVSLTDTKAENVVAAGEKASITADEKSTVAEVSVGGDAPKVELKGEVRGDVFVSGSNANVKLEGVVSGSVTVEEGAAGVTVTVPKGTEVSNESGGSVSVNGSAVAPGVTAAAP